MSSGRAAEQQIHVQLRRAWTAAPLDLIEAGHLSPTARLIMLYLLALAGRPGWVIRVSQVRRALGLSEGVWSRARTELQAAGLYSLTRTRCDDGKLRWAHVVHDEPTIPPKSMDGSSMDGRAGDVVRSNVPRLKKQHARPRARAAAASQHQRASQGSVIHGVECWTDQDRAAAADLTEHYGEGALLQAAMAVSGHGHRPLPSRVSAQLVTSVAASTAAEAERSAAAAAAAAERRLAMHEALGRIEADLRLGLIDEPAASALRAALFEAV